MTTTEPAQACTHPRELVITGEAGNRQCVECGAALLAAPVRGALAYVIDQIGATFAFPTVDAAVTAYQQEQERGARALLMYHVTIPRDGMTWDEVADHACTVGPDGIED